MGKSAYNKANGLVDLANEAKVTGDGEAMYQILSEIQDASDEITNSIALFSSLLDAIQNEYTGLNIEISNSKNNKAKAEAARIMEEAQLQIEREKQSAIRDIRAQVAQLSVQIAEKVVRTNLSSDAQQMQLIDRMLDEVQVENK